MNTLKTLSLTLIAVACFAGEATPSFADEAYAKAVDASSKKAESAYEAYQKELAAASAAVIKSLEATIKELNDPKKYAKLGMKERAAAIEELEKKIAAVKEGAVGEGIVAKKGREGDLLGDVKVDLAKAIVGKWRRTGNNEDFNCEFLSDGTGVVGPHKAVWENGANGNVKITFPGKPAWFINVTITANKVTGILDNGKEVVFTRIK
jgi:hypothetical protein